MSAEPPKTDPKIDPPADDPPQDTPIKDPPIDDDPFLKLLEGMLDEDKKTVVNTVNMLTKRVAELETEMKETSDKSDVAAKKIIIDMLEAAGYDVAGLEKKSLQSLEDTAELLGQKNNKIIITRKDDSDNDNPNQNKTRMWENTDKKFYYWEDRNKSNKYELYDKHN